MLTNLVSKNFANRAYTKINKSIIKANASSKPQKQSKNNNINEVDTIKNKLKLIKDNIKEADIRFNKLPKEYKEDHKVIMSYSNLVSNLQTNHNNLSKNLLDLLNKQGYEPRLPDKIGLNFVNESLTHFYRLDTGVSGDYFTPYSPGTNNQEEQMKNYMQNKSILIEQKASNNFVLEYKDQNKDHVSAFMELYPLSISTNFNPIDNENSDNDLNIGYFEEEKVMKEVTLINDNYVYNEELDDARQQDRPKVVMAGEYRLSQPNSDPIPDKREKSFTKLSSKYLP